MENNKGGRGKRAGSGTSAPGAGRRKRGRPPGPTEQAQETQAHIYKTAIDLFVRRGYEATTLRQIATRAKVSPALLYRYFPGKRAVVRALYEELSIDYLIKALAMPAGGWGGRFVFALRASLEVLGPHRRALAALLPALLGEGEENLFSAGAARSRWRVQAAFTRAVTEATDAPAAETGEALGRVLYLAHLAVLLWWLHDQSAKQAATQQLVAHIEQLLPAASLLLAMPAASAQLATLDGLIRQALPEHPF